VKHYHPEVFDSTTSLILMSCFEFVVIGQVISHMWHLFIDKKLSMALSKLEAVNKILIQLNVVRPMKVKMKWFFIVGVILNCIGFNIHTVMIIKRRFNQNVQSYISPVINNIIQYLILMYKAIKINRQLNCLLLFNVNFISLFYLVNLLKVTIIIIFNQ